MFAKYLSPVVARSTPSPPPVNFVFIGDPGAGKNTSINCLIGHAVFESGVSCGGNQHVQTYKHGDNVQYMDTPGLADRNTQEKAAAAITEALQQSGVYKLFFMVRLENGRVVSDDLATIEIVLSSIEMDDIPKEGADYLNVMTVINSIKHTTPHIAFFPEIDDLDEEYKVVAQLPDDVESFIRFEAPTVQISPESVKPIQIQDIKKVSGGLRDAQNELLNDKAMLDQRMAEFMGKSISRNVTTNMATTGGAAGILAEMEVQQQNKRQITDSTTNQRSNEAQTTCDDPIASPEMIQRFQQYLKQIKRYPVVRTGVSSLDSFSKPSAPQEVPQVSDPIQHNTAEKASQKAVEHLSGDGDEKVQLSRNNSLMECKLAEENSFSYGGIIGQVGGIFASAVGYFTPSMPHNNYLLGAVKSEGDDMDLNARVSNQKEGSKPNTSVPTTNQVGKLVNLPEPLVLPSITAQIVDLFGLCGKMSETKSVCEDILSRLISIQYWLDERESTVGSGQDLKVFKIGGTFRDFLVQHGNQSIIERLVSTSSCLAELRELHYMVDKLETEIGFTPVKRSSLDWDQQWGKTVQNVEQGLKTMWETSQKGLRRELPDPESQARALMLLQSEIRQHQTVDTSASCELLKSATTRIVRLSGASVEEVPAWFIPSHAVQMCARPFNSGSFGEVFHGTWRGSDVVIKCVTVTSPEEKRMFLREAKIWYSLRHPHIATFFGACHVNRPCFFVCEWESNGNLVDYLDKMKGKEAGLVWQKLREAALGLRFLHGKSIVHGDLKCNQMLVTAQGVIKLTDFGLSFISSGSKPEIATQATRWMAPECLISEGPPTFESDVYSFGMCVVEAVTNSLPWGIYLPDVAIRDRVINREFLSKPNQFTSDQWDLVLSLCAFEPSSRLSLSSAIDKLQWFEDEVGESPSSAADFS
ncbi:hypothetical protein PHYPSEUDO_008764 [Phytophthora pseudosyringae]|uniref:Protein kinase domain-containing protein n=1 Tax=Phytophthora pseudosyringae TaxID=221518 RepID=A0A8T1VGD8_9STRA|nr:hypothetical protein PHYPSEUDO_008764 [Phytophthora pseudosyringae]